MRRHIHASPTLTPRRTAAELTRIHEKHAAHGRVHDAQLTKLEEAVAKLESMYKDAEENLVKLCAVLGVRCEL